MAAPVWSLSVNLETKTAVFQSGLADAARAARSSFQDIKESAAEMGGSTSRSMLETRESVVLLGDQLGIHMPRALSQFVASLGPVAGAMEAAFPYIALIAGATILIERLTKLHGEAAKQAQAWSKLGDESETALQKTEREIKQTQNAIDELTGGPLVRLRHQLEAIDQQKFDTLEGNIAKVGGEIDKLLGEQQRGTVMSMLFGQNFEGDLKAGFDKFRNAYSSLLQTGDTKLAAQELEKEIGDVGTKLEALQKQSESGYTPPGLTEDLATARAVYNQLIAISAQQEDQQKLASTKKTLATDTADPEVLYPALFVNAESQKRVSLQQTMELAKKVQEEINEGEQQEYAFRQGVIQQIAKEGEAKAKLAEQAGKEDAGHSLRMAKLQLEADKEAGKMMVTNKRETAAQVMDVDLAAAKREYEIQRDAYNQEINALDNHGNDYENRLKALQNKQTELTREHENQVTQIRDRAEQERTTRIISAEQHMNDEIARGLTQTLMGHETFAKMMVSLGDQVVSGMMENAIKSIMANDMTKESDAAAAARKAYLAGMHFPFPVNIVMGPVLGAMAFASVMAFEEGGIVPGTGVGDSVPSLLTPGEAILPKRMTEDLQHAAKFGGDNGGGDVHVHYHHTSHIQAFDSTGVDKVLQQHGDKFTQHAVRTLRKMNR